MGKVAEDGRSRSIFTNGEIVVTFRCHGKQVSCAPPFKLAATAAARVTPAPGRTIGPDRRESSLAATALRPLPPEGPHFQKRNRTTPVGRSSSAFMRPKSWLKRRPCDAPRLQRRTAHGKFAQMGCPRSIETSFYLDVVVTRTSSLGKSDPGLSG